MVQFVNYELIAIKLGDALKWSSSVKEIERIAKATLKVPRKEFPQESITSVRAQAIYDWVISLAHSPLPEEEKRERLSSFIYALPLGDEVRNEMKRLLGISRIAPQGPPQFDCITSDVSLVPILEARWREIQKCVENEAYLAAIIMMGSLLEGLLLAVVHGHPKEANLATSVPRNRDGKTKPFHEWTLNNLIAVSHECGWIERDIKDFSLELRDYRNMVHPWHQRTKGFHPDMDTARICWEVVNAALNDLLKNIK